MCVLLLIENNSHSDEKISNVRMQLVFSVSHSPTDPIDVLSQAANLTPLCRSTVKQASKHQADTVFYLILDEEQR